ncbi:MAG: MFS transporter, partial [Polyangiaceae bacterium]
PEGDRSAGVGLLFTGSSVGAMIAAPTAIALNKHFGWRFAFVGTALVGLLWIPCWLLATRGAKGVLAPHPRENVKTHFFREAATTLSELGRQGAVIRALILVVASAPGIMFVLNWFPQYLADAHAVVQNDIGKYAWCPPLFFDLGAVGFGVAASRRERKGLSGAHSDLVAFAAMLAATLACLSLAQDAVEATIVASASMAGGGALFALLTGDMLSRIDPARVSRAGGLTAAAQSLAYVIASPIVGTVVDSTHTYDRVLLGLGAIVVPGAAAWIAWPGIAPRRKD